MAKIKGKFAFVINSVQDNSNPRVPVAGEDCFTVTLSKAKSIADDRDIFVVLRDDHKPLFRDIPKEVNRIFVKSNSVYEILFKIYQNIKGRYNLIVYIFSDEPLFDVKLTEKLVESHIEELSDYTYGEGFLPGALPEVVSSETLLKLISLIKDKESPVKRDSLFELLSKDINSFDIESIFPDEDIRLLKVELTASRKINRIIVEKLVSALGGFDVSYRDVCSTIKNNPEIVRTVPAFVEVEITDRVNHPVPYLPVDAISRKRGEMDVDSFHRILEIVHDFSEDPYISISYISEPLLHPEIKRLVELASGYENLKLIIETDGILFNPAFSNFIVDLKSDNIFVIFQIDAVREETYKRIHGTEIRYPERNLRYLISKGFKNAFAQMVRMNINEDEMIEFYNMWKKEGVNVVIQKFNDFAGVLPRLSHSDLRPLDKICCYHLMRDMVIFYNGDVPRCKQDINGNAISGNIFNEDIEKVWSRGNRLFVDYCNDRYSDDCRKCDEYYIFNF